MTNNLTERQALGLDESHLADYDGRVKVHRDLLAPLSLLAQRLQARGCQLAVASGYRSFERQLAIFNAKADGQVPVLDDRGQPLALSRLSARETLFAILRFSALPGASRHHWGTDIDVYDKAAVTAGYRLQLVQAEYSRGGIFQRLSEHLPACMGPAGFFRPYRDDCGGVAPEPGT